MAEYDLPADELTIAFQDYSDEKSYTGVYIAPITADNYDATMVATGVLIAAMRNLTLCNPDHMAIRVAGKFFNMGRPTSKWAQRENSLLVSYADNVTGQKGRVSIPGVDWNALAGEGDFVDYQNLQWIAFKTAFEAVARSADGNPVTIQYAKYVGRRS